MHVCVGVINRLLLVLGRLFAQDHVFILVPYCGYRLVMALLIGVALWLLVSLSNHTREQERDYLRELLEQEKSSP